MCLGIPLRIVEINGTEALGELNGVRKKIRVDLIKDLKLGDYVMVHAGFALEIMKEEEAKDTLEILEEMEKLI